MPHWPSIYGFALGLIAANLAGRIASKHWGEGTAVGDLVGVYTFGAMAAVAIAAGIWWGVRRDRKEITGELLPIFVVATLFTVLVNPLIARVDFPSLDGVFSQTLIYFALLALSGWVGFLIVMALGVDVYGRQLKATRIAFERKANPKAA
jgi:asparagine N-glycosylation enzyme membrane subunit Stt3